MPRFRKKPVVIEAVQFDGENSSEIFAWLLSDLSSPHIRKVDESGVLVIRTLEGDMTAQKGDWIIQGVQGEFYPCKPDIFSATYESVSEPAGSLTPQVVS
jgi:hypothetical protein